jgi:thymidylate kinase
LAAREPKRIRLLDASQPAEILAQEIFRIVEMLLAAPDGKAAGQLPH